MTRPDTEGHAVSVRQRWLDTEALGSCVGEQALTDQRDEVQARCRDALELMRLSSRLPTQAP